MHAFLYTSENYDVAQNSAETHAKSLVTHPLDFVLADNEHFERDAKKKKNINLTVAATREIIKESYISPIGDTKVIYFPHAENITINSQNALLKLIEEPPADVFFFFVTTSPRSLLATIISRAQTVRVKSDKKDKNDEILQKLAPLCKAYSQKQSAENRYKLELALMNLKDDKVSVVKTLEQIFSLDKEQADEIPLSFAAEMQKRIVHAMQQVKANCNWQGICWSLVKE